MRIARECTIVLTLCLLSSGVASAQKNPPADTSASGQAYENRRAELIKELQQTQDQLGALRSERVRLEARIDNAMARSTQQRTQQLLMSNEQNALLQLDAVLATSQETMAAQRDRMHSLGEAVKHRSGAVLVVMLRADSGQTVQLGSAELKVDDGPPSQRTYTAVAQGALQQGAVDMLFRSEVLPTPHTVRLSVAIGGQPITQSISVDAKGETVTYVQFAVRGGELVPSSWTSQGTTPF